MKRLIGNFSIKEAFNICDYENELLVKPISKIYDKKLSDLIPVNSVVVDFGGNLGDHYYSINVSVKQWIVVETPTKVKAGIGNSILKFTTEIPKNADVVLCSGSLQYTPNWRKTLIELIRTGADLFIFKRMSFGKEKTTLQKSWLSENAGDSVIKDRLIFYPHTTIPKKEFKLYLEGLNYVIL